MLISLKGLEYFTGLETLYCYKNQLTSLDVSKNRELQSLYCYKNQLTSLDLSKNKKLDSASTLLSEQNLTCKVPFVDNAWKLDLASIVGVNNLSKVRVTAATPSDYAYANGFIVFTTKPTSFEFTYDTEGVKDMVVVVTVVSDEEALPGDTNGDGYVNAKDNALISAAFGGKASDPNSNYNPAADLNNDGFVNAKDRAIVIANFGKRS